MAELFDARPCLLGEGPLWHPGRGQLFWFDILGRKILTQSAAGPGEFPLPEYFSAAGWIDGETLLATSETGFWRLSAGTGALERIMTFPFAAPGLRSNDGRADPWGGFWIGMMGKRAEAGAGSIWRLHRGEMRQLYSPVTIPNAISFTPDRRFAHFADSEAGKVWRVALDGRDGWPSGEPEVYLDLTGQAGVPDGAVCDAEGNLWLAEWGASRVAVYDAAGRFLHAVAVEGRHSSCPAFGGPGLSTLYVTSARENLTAEVIAAEPLNGCTFAAETGVAGQAEHRVVL
jgi:sugar lactone lactonase YvrE